MLRILLSLSFFFIVLANLVAGGALAAPPEWAENWKYANRRIEPSLALLRANRHHTVELVQQTPDAWEKSIRLKWPEGEEERITIGEVLEMQASHVVGHVNDIQMIRQAHITKI
jgi:hypothetical protein